MSEHQKERASDNAGNTMGGGETDLVGMVKKIQQHLVYLEKKIDLLVGQSGGGSSQGGGRPFNKFKRPGGGFPRRERSFDGPPRHSGGDRGDNRGPRPERPPVEGNFQPSSGGYQGGQGGGGGGGGGFKKKRFGGR